jgi:hypothetical protein
VLCFVVLCLGFEDDFSDCGLTNRIIFWLDVCDVESGDM